MLISGYLFIIYYNKVTLLFIIWAILEARAEIL